MRTWPLLLCLVAAALVAGPTAAARPTDGSVADDGYAAGAEVHTWDTAHFRIHWVSEGGDAATAPFVKEVGTVMEQVWRVEVDELGWPAPPQDDGVGGSDRVDVYLLDLDDGPFGYATADRGATCTTCGPVHGFLVLDNDYRGYPPSPGAALRATAAHEFAHLIHFGIAYDGEGWAYEATAVWMERVVFPEADARTEYVRDFADLPHLPLSDFDVDTGGFDRAYGAYVWNVWLESRHGPEVVRDAWLAAADADQHVMEGYDTALRTRGSSLTREIVAFTAATAAWERGGFPGEPAAYPPIARDRFIALGSREEIRIDHAAAFVADIEPAEEVTVTVRGPRFVAGGVALIAAAGSEVLSAVDASLFDGEATVTLEGVADAGRLTLVVVNSDVSLARPKPVGSDRPAYLHDGITYVLGVGVDPGAPPKER